MGKTAFSSGKEKQATIQINGMWSKGIMKYILKITFSTRHVRELV